jgi:YEATS domain-containing protein 4
MSLSQTLPLKRQQGENPSDDGSSAIKPSRLKISLPSEDSDKKVKSLCVFSFNYKKIIQP